MTNLVLTPEASAEVKRNLLICFGVIAGSLLVILFLLALVINPTGGTQGFQFALLLLVGFCFPMLAMLGASLTLSYLMGCWPGFMRGQRLAEIYGIDAEDISNKAIRGWMKRAVYWKAFAKGSVVGFVFIAPWFFVNWAMNRNHFPEGSVFPAIWLVLFCGGLSAKTLIVRHVVSEKAALPVGD